MAVRMCLGPSPSEPSNLQNDFPNLHDTLPIEYEYHLCSYKEVDGGYTADLRVAITSEEIAKKWIADYQEKSKVTLRVKATKPNSGKINLFATYYRCQHNTLPRSSTADKRRSTKNTNCPAEISVVLKRFMGNKSRAKTRDMHLPKFALKVGIRYMHNHAVFSADSVKQHDVSKETIDIFKDLFSRGHSPSSALNTHKLNLQVQYGPEYVMKAADRANCPDLYFCHRYCKKDLDAGRPVNASTQTSSAYPATPGVRVPMTIESLPFFKSPLVPKCDVRKIQDDGKLQDHDVDSSSAGKCSVMSQSGVEKMSDSDADEPSLRIMADKKTGLKVIKSEIKEEPQSSEEPYKTYIVKEEDLEDDWTENDAKEVSEEQQSSERTEKSVVEEEHLKEGQQREEVQKRFHTDSVQEADSEDGWTEDDDAKETEAQQSKEADHQTFKYLIKEEPVDSDSADDDDDVDGTALQATSQSCSKQGGDSRMQSSYQSKRNTLEMSSDRSCDGARHLPEDFPLQAILGTQSGSSERKSCTSGNSRMQSSHQSMRNTREMSGDISRDGERRPSLQEDFYLGTKSDSSERGSCPSEYDSCLIPSQVAYFHEKRAADRETLDATTSSHKPGRMDIDRNADITMENDEMINQSSELRATGSNQNDPSCSLAKEKPFLCCVCSKGFTLRTSLSRHMKIHGGEKPHECTFCNKRFLYGNGLKRHLRNHTGEKPYRCSVCDRGFNERGHLTQHMTVHTGEKSYQCKLCDKKYSRSNGLHAHMRTHTGEKPYQCKFCDKKYSRSNGLHEHLRTHTGEKPYQCMYCDVRFSCGYMLSIHIRSHTGEKPFECFICNKTFSNTAGLSRHNKIHTGERPYECSFCKKTFSQAHHLSRHIKIHTGEKPFECSVCSKTFSERGYLTDHQKTHTGEKPYLCPVCGKSFSHKFSLTNHMTIHSGEKPHVCLICNKAFSQRRYLLRHKTIHTKETNMEKS